MDAMVMRQGSIQEPKSPFDFDDNAPPAKAGNNPDGFDFGGPEVPANTGAQAPPSNSDFDF